LVSEFKVGTIIANFSQKQKSMKNCKVMLLALATLGTMSVFGQDKKAKNELKSEKTVEEIIQVEETTDVQVEIQNPAKYPGGNEALFKFMGENIKYPKYEMKEDIQGKVLVEFVIKSDGSISDVAILKSVEKSKNLDAEVKRVIAKMPNWIPATKDGEAVNSKMVLPVMFKL
tara:strand:- start:65945 stop:66460 length:516 start_codon:yes stop_codon:yes gene_type:complete